MSDSSDDDFKAKKGVADDSDDSDSGRKGKTRGRQNTTRFLETDSASDLSGSESEMKPSSSKKRKIATKKSVAKKKRGRGSSEDEAAPRIQGADSLELTEEERAKLHSMSEKDREQEIFKRMEELEARRIRETIEQRLREKNGEVDEEEKKESKRKAVTHSEDEEDDDLLSEDESPKKKASPKKVKKVMSESEDDVRVNPSEAHRKKKQKSAMEDLVNRRKEKEAKKASLAVDQIFGGRSSSSSSSSASSRSSSPTSRSSSPSRKGSPERGKEDAIDRRPVETREELKKAQITRRRLAKIVHAPFFAKTVIDCFVRVGAGQMPGKPTHNNYRIAKIIDVVETAKVYNVENTRTNKGLKLQWGKESRVFRLEFVSNNELTLPEFTEYMEIMKAFNIPLPTVSEVMNKSREMEEALNHAFTNEEVDALIKEKGRFKQAPKNYAMTKGELMKKLEFAKENGQHSEVHRLHKEIYDLDQKADMLDKRRSGDISAIDWINKRNRQMMKDQFLGQKTEGDWNREDDPFTRKSGKMKVVSGSAKNLAALADADPTTGGAAASVPATQSSSSSSSLIGSPAPKVIPKSKANSDLFSLHSCKIDLDIDVDTSRVPVTEEKARSTQVIPPTKGRPLSLEDYKKRKAEAM